MFSTLHATCVSLHKECTLEMLSAFYSNVGQSEILSSDNGLNSLLIMTIVMATIMRANLHPNFLERVGIVSRITIQYTVCANCKLPD